MPDFENPQDAAGALVDLDRLAPSDWLRRYDAPLRDLLRAAAEESGAAALEVANDEAKAAEEEAGDLAEALCDTIRAAKAALAKHGYATP